MAIALRGLGATTTLAGVNTATPAKPAGLTAGDLMIVQCSFGSGYTQAPENTFPPAGWKILAFQQDVEQPFASSGAATTILFWKIATAGDVAAPNLGAWSFPGYPYGHIIPSAWSGVHQVDPIAHVSQRHESTNGNTAITFPEAVDLYGNSMALIVSVEAQNVGATTPPAGYTEVWELGTGPGGSNGEAKSYGAYKLNGAAGLMPEVTAAIPGNGVAREKGSFTILLRDANAADISAPHIRGHASQHELVGPTYIPNVGIQLGDLLILVFDGFNVAEPAPVLPAGWNLLASRVSAVGYLSRTIYYKVATAAELIARIPITGVGYGGNSHSFIFLVVANAGSPLPPATTMSNAASFTMSAPAITVPSTNSLLLDIKDTLGAYAQTSPAAGYTEYRDQAHYVSNGERMASIINARVVNVAGVQPAAVSVPNEVSQYWAATHIAIQPNNAAPNAPTLVAPGDGQSSDIAATPTFQWIFGDPNSADTQSGFYIRRKIVGAPAYEYYNSTTGLWQAGEFKIVQAAQSFTFPAGKWTNGLLYNWSIATEDQLNTKGPYATDFTVRGGTAPSVTVTAPAGSVTDNVRPPASWTVADVEGDPQETAEVRYESGAYGTVPGFGVAVIGSGEIAEPYRRSWTPTIDLNNGTTYRVFVRVRTSGQYSAWSYTTFTLSLTPPPTPAVVATFEAALNRVRLDLTLALAGQTYRVERSDDGGITWNIVRGCADVPRTAAVTTVYDYEPPPNKQARYRASTRAVV